MTRISISTTVKRHCNSQKLRLPILGSQPTLFMTRMYPLVCSFHRTIQPTSWSRKRGLTGLDPLKVPIGLLTRHGASEFGLRTLSNGRFFLASSVAGMFQKQFLVVSYFGPFVKPKLTLILLQSFCTESLIPKGSCLPRPRNRLFLWNLCFKK